MNKFPLCIIVTRSQWVKYSSTFKDHSGYGRRQWEMVLQCNVLSHWLSPYPKWSLTLQCQNCVWAVWSGLASHCFRNVLLSYWHSYLIPLLLVWLLSTLWSIFILNELHARVSDKGGADIEVLGLERGLPNPAQWGTLLLCPAEIDLCNGEQIRNYINYLW